MDIDYQGIDLSYAVESESIGQKYPSLQASNYKPSNPKEKIELCLSQESHDLLQFPNVIKFEPIEAYFDAESYTMQKFPDEIRWVILDIPKTYVLDKSTGKIDYLKRGVKFAGTSNVSISRVYLAALVGDDFSITATGAPQIFTLKLTSTKTQLINNFRDPEYKSISKLNKALQSHYKTKNNLIHLVSVKLQASPYKFTSSKSGESSLGIMFELTGNAKPLSKINQGLIYELLQDPEITQDLKDPFRLEGERKEYVNPGSNSNDMVDNRRKRRGFKPITERYVNPWSNLNDNEVPF